MTPYRTPDEVLRFLESALGEEPLVLDFGLLDAAPARPAVAVFGKCAYLTPEF